jgi:hypothetical protein
MFLTIEQRRAIGSANAGTLDSVIERIKRQNPRAFHTEDTLDTRVFFNQPMRGEPCKGFIRFAPKENFVL